MTFESFARDVGRTLRRAQEDSPYSIDDLAKRSGLSRFTIMKMFDGKPATLRSIFVLCQAMNTKPGICIVGVCTEENT